MSNTKTRKVCFNAKPHLKILLSHGVELFYGLRDPKIAAWVLQSEANKVLYIFFYRYLIIMSISDILLLFTGQTTRPALLGIYKRFSKYQDHFQF